MLVTPRLQMRKGLSGPAPGKVLGFCRVACPGLAPGNSLPRFRSRVRSSCDWMLDTLALQRRTRSGKYVYMSGRGKPPRAILQRTRRSNIREKMIAEKRESNEQRPVKEKGMQTSPEHQDLKKNPAPAIESMADMMKGMREW